MPKVKFWQAVFQKKDAKKLSASDLIISSDVETISRLAKMQSSFIKHGKLTLLFIIYSV